ncbi:MAG TPA: type II secretion system F family protein [Gemmataceae bacterium]|nr:type II secretion system F family protein [Gemmataceae bacterium]
MFLSPRLPLSSTIELCRVMRHYLGAGLTLRDVFKQQATRGDMHLRPVAGRISAKLEQGEALEDALKREGGVFPPLLTSLANVGEQTGMLPEVFTELEKYYVRQQQLRRTFLTRAAWPAFQFLAAIFVLAGLICIMGWIPQSSGQFALHYDPVGLGLSGSGGALIFLALVLGLLLFLAVLYFAAKRLMGGGAVDGFLLRVPILGRCLRALALTRFCLALRLTLETGMPIAKALRLSFRATGNAAFTDRLDKATAGVKKGDELTTALAATGLFPQEFQHIIAVAEESGRMTEVLRQEAEHYHDEADRRMAALTRAMTVLVWLIVATFIIVFIFRIFSQYVDLFNQVG